MKLSLVWLAGLGQRCDSAEGGGDREPKRLLSGQGPGLFIPVSLGEAWRRKAGRTFSGL